MGAIESNSARADLFLSKYGLNVQELGMDAALQDSISIVTRQTQIRHCLHSQQVLRWLKHEERIDFYFQTIYFTI